MVVWFPSPFRIRNINHRARGRRVEVVSSRNGDGGGDFRDNRLNRPTPFISPRELHHSVHGNSKKKKKKKFVNKNPEASRKHKIRFTLRRNGKA